MAEPPIDDHWYTCGGDKADCEDQAIALCEERPWLTWAAEFFDATATEWWTTGGVPGACDELEDWTLQEDWPGIEACSEHCE